MSLSTCTKEAAKFLSPERINAIFARTKELRDSGMTNKEASRQAVQQILEERRQALTDKLAEARASTVLDGQDALLSKARPTSDAGHKREMSSGRYVGAPDWVGSSPQKLIGLRKNLRQLATEGEPGRYWYEQSSRAILDLAAGDKEEAERIVSLIAIYSPNATVPANTSMALRAYFQWKAGEPIKAGLGANNRKATELLVDGKPWSGIKTNSFYQNLMAEIDASKLDEGVATMDMWMALAFDYGDKALDQGPKYRFAERETQRLAAELGWKAHQVQAAIWTAVKGRIDPIRPELRARELKLGIGEMVDDEGKQVYKIKKGREADHFHLAFKMGMNRTLPPQDVQESKYDFSDAIRERTAQMSWEATPGRSTGVLPGIFDAPIHQKFEYLEAINKALTTGGQDIIAKKIGLPLQRTFFGFSAWEGDIGAGAQSTIGVALEGAGDKRTLTPEARKLINLYAAIKGYVLNQEAVVWHVPSYDGALKNQNGIEGKFHRALTEDEMRQLYTALNSRFNTWEIAPGYTESGFRILNFSIDNKEFQRGMQDVLELMPESFGGGIIDFRAFRSVGDYISNDWKEAPNGEQYRAQIEGAAPARGDAGRSDLSQWAADLRANIQAVNADFAERYGWDQAGPGDTQEVSRSTVRTVQVDGVRYPDTDSKGHVLAPMAGGGIQGQINFWRWFRGSKVVDEQGRPLVVYHGTSRSFNSFSLNEGRNTDMPRDAQGFYFTKFPDDAAAYATNADGDTAEGGNTMPVYLRLENPLVVERGDIANHPAYISAEKRAKLEAAGHDGIMYGNGTEYIVFRPEQIKSATGNNGQFDPTTGDITQSRPRSLFNPGFNEALPRGYIGEPDAEEQRLADAVANAESGASQAWAAGKSAALKRIREELAPKLKATGLEPNDEMLASMAQSLFYNERQKDGDDTPEFARYRELAAKVPELRREYLDAVAKRIGPPEFEGMRQLADFHRPITDTKSFKRWFDGSKVVDKEGRPLIVFHGTNRDFTQFRTVLPGDKQVSNNNWMGELGSWFAAPNDSGDYDVGNAEATADVFAEMRSRDSEIAEGAAVYPVFLSIKNPYEAEGYDDITEQRDDAGGGKAFREMLIADGYDGVVIRDSNTDGGQYRDDWIAFHPEQIKSALGNGGEFDPESGDITRSEARQVETPEFKRWFGNSKIREEDGSPKVLYHMTPANFKQFEPGGHDDRISGAAIWLSGEAAYQAAAHNNYNRAGEFKEGVNVMPVYVRMERPLLIDDKTSLDWAREVFANGSREFPQVILPQWAHELTKDGEYDGILFKGAAWNGTERDDEYIVFDPKQIKSAIGNSGDFNPASADITQSTGRSSTGAAWDSPSASKFDDLVYKLQDKHVETKRVVEAIKAADGAIRDDLNVYLQEELFHGRAAKRTDDFVHMELQPLVEQMARDGLTMADVEEFLHARHAKEANEVIAQRNPGVAALQDGGSGMMTAVAQQYLAGLDPAERTKLEAAAARVDAIIAHTRQLYVDYQLESQDTVDGWGRTFQHYIPLQREDKDGSPGIGQGFSIKGKETKGRTGSTRKVVDILANIAMARERAITRGEKNRVSQALVGLATANPNPGFWTVNEVPHERVFDPDKGIVVDRADPMYKNRENALVAKIMAPDGSVKEHAVLFNEDDERAMRMAAALKNLDAAKLEGILGLSAKVTRYFAAINTQYNPVFGVVNLMRDVQAAILNSGSTAIKGDGKKIARDAIRALVGVYADMRAVRKGGTASSHWSQLWEEFQHVGGQTGYRDMFRTSADRAKAIEKELNPDAWMNSKLGKIFTANGALKMPIDAARKVSGWVFDWLSDYNEAMENGTRLAAYKAGLDRGLSKEQAASIAKNLTVNFNRKGQVAQQAGALYAFFNASAQGSARVFNTLFDMEPGKPKTIRLSSTGKKIVYGGLLLGSLQAMMLAAAGFNDEDPPDFVRERSLIIPIGGKKYVTIPMPQGFHVIPNAGRIATEFALSGFKDPQKRAKDFVGILADSFNPIGNAGLSIQTLAPTALDPLVALSENRDWTGKPIARTSSNKAIPGHALARDTSTSIARALSEGINALSGGNHYVAGVLSPTPDQIDYLIGQVTGGVGRELSKVEQTGLALARGEDLPTHKVPLIGRFYGDAHQQASEGNSFYANSEMLNRIETEVKGLQKDGKSAEARAVLKAHPESYLIAMANTAERELMKLRSEKRDLVDKGAPREKVKSVEESITQVMSRLNRAVEKARGQSQ